MGFLDELNQSLGPGITDQLSSQLNIDRSKAETVLPSIAPLVLGGLKRQKDDHGGDERIDHILNNYGNEDALGNLDGYFNEAANISDPDPALGGLLGDSGHQAANLLGDKLGIGKGLASKLIPMLAPLILGKLNQQRGGSGDGASGSQSGGGSLIGSILDRDGDGSILDDVAGMVFSGGSGGGSTKGGCLSSILGGILGGRK